MSPTPPRHQPITLAVLLHSEAMREVNVRPRIGTDRPIRRVQLIDDVEHVRACQPGTLVVLQGHIATTAWSMSVAIRYAWERHVPCLVGQVDLAASPSVLRLAEHLNVSIGYCTGSLADLALDLATIIGSPAATRARVLASCAARIVEQETVEGVVQAVTDELPELRVKVAPKSHEPPPPGTGPDVTAVTMPFGVLDPFTERELRATLVAGGMTSEWVALVRDVLAIARSQILACESALATRSQTRRDLARWALARLTDTHDAHAAARTVDNTVPTGDTRAAEQLGWQLDGRIIAAVILCGDSRRDPETVDTALAAVLPAMDGVVGPVRHQDGWALWRCEPAEGAASASGGDDVNVDGSAVRELTAAISAAVAGAGLGVPLVAGVGTLAEGVVGLGVSLRRAHLAARTARATGRAVAVFDELGPSAFVCAADTPDLRSLARELLGPVHAVDDAASLVVTIAAYLDCGGSTARTAAWLGVHRNTVTARLERIRRLGVPLDDPRRRLALHIAAHLDLTGYEDPSLGAPEPNQTAPTG